MPPEQPHHHVGERRKFLHCQDANSTLKAPCQLRPNVRRSGNRTMTMYSIAARSSFPTMNLSYGQVERNAVTHAQQSAINLIKHRLMTSATRQKMSDVVGFYMNPPDRVVVVRR